MKMDLLSHITSLPTRTEMLVESPRTAAVKKCVLDILEAAKDPNNKETLQRFSHQLFALLQSPLQLQSSATMAKRRELMWTKYINLRESVLPGLWKSLLVEMKCSDIMREPLFMELVNESVFEELTKAMYTPAEEQRNTPADTNFSKDEQNILRYACGYVAMKLHRRYLKQHGIKAATFAECLEHMEVEGPTSSLLAYTREWVDQTNRGGLFDISDAGYFLFVVIEVAMRDKLLDRLTPSSQTPDSKEGIIRFVTSDSDVLFHWEMLSVDIENAQNSAELLEEIVKLWLTIRGFSISRAWIEDYKVLVSQATAKKKSLRKHLKQN